jgi:hypothetical protein
VPKPGWETTRVTGTSLICGGVQAQHLGSVLIRLRGPGSAERPGTNSSGSSSERHRAKARRYEGAAAVDQLQDQPVGNRNARTTDEHPHHRLLPARSGESVNLRTYGSVCVPQGSERVSPTVPLHQGPAAPAETCAGRPIPRASMRPCCRSRGRADARVGERALQFNDDQTSELSLGTLLLSADSGVSNGPLVGDLIAPSERTRNSGRPADQRRRGSRNRSLAAVASGSRGRPETAGSTALQGLVVHRHRRSGTRVGPATGCRRGRRYRS